MSDDVDEIAHQVADTLMAAEHTAAVAESLTGGRISAGLSAIEAASDWFKGGVVAYNEDVKFELLGVDPGPVVTAECALQMAQGVARLLKADFAVSATGVGGPGPHEDRPAGTVFVAVATPNSGSVSEYHFDGDPPKVVEQASRQALRDLADFITPSSPR